MCAAVAAARGGSKVVLMHERPVLGGNASSEIRMWICGAQGENNRETGILEEICLENYYRNPTKNYYIWDTVLYDFVVREPNITLLLNCTCMDAEVKKGEFEYGRDIKIECVAGYQMTTQIFFDVYADYYADCSGDSILAPLTGADCRIGRESADEFGEDTQVLSPDNMTMGMSCLIQGRETQHNIKFTPPEWSAKLNAEAFEGKNPDINKSGENFWYLELGGDRDSIHDTEGIRKDLIPLALGTWDYIKNSAKFSADKWELEFLSFLPGKRESRRMMGEYLITQRDISAGTVFSDTVAYGGWPLDDHFPGGFYHKGKPNTAVKTPSPYCIPYRALYSKNIGNLFFAGRNISATHLAMSSTRVMATCAVIGQAVGTAADIARAYKLSPHGVYGHKLKELQTALMDNDCFLPNSARAVSKLCANTPVTNGGDNLKNAQDRPHELYGSTECGIKITNNTPLEYRFGTEQTVNSIHIVFDSDLNRETLPGNKVERQHSMRSNVLIGSPQFYVPKTLCREFTLELLFEDHIEKLLDIKENRKRAYHISVRRKVNGIRLTPIKNWGDTDNTAVFSFDFL